MKPFALLAAAISVCLSAPAHAAPGGGIGTIPLGKYICETTGDALGDAGVHQPQFDFQATRGSSYRTATGSGVYLLTGLGLVFTSGPFEGMWFRHVRAGFLRAIEADGKDGNLRCVRGMIAAE